MIRYQTDLNGITKEQLEGFFVGWSVPFTKEEHYEILQNSYMIVLAIDTETNNVVGFVNAISDKLKFAFIPMLEVLPPFKNMGIGKRLMETLLSKLEHLSCIDLMCDPEMQPYYEKFKLTKSHGMVIRRFLKK